MDDIFANKILLITGGTGSFGHAVLNRFLNTSIKEIRIFSRDEKKQDDMRHEYQAIYPQLSEKIKFYIGDIRNIQSIKEAIVDVDYVFHAAALKQVPSCEFFPMEAVFTNIIGTNNLLTVAIEYNVKKIVCLSTDKAAYPINAMGKSKAMMENVYISKSRLVSQDKTLICGTRYGNVLCSRGSVVPLFIEQIKAGKPLTVTEPRMTRFLMSLEEAVELVVYAFKNAHTGDLMVQKSPASTIGDLAQAVKEIFHADNEINYIGIRHGEKLSETLLTSEECWRAEDCGNYYRVPSDNRCLNYDNYFTKGNVDNTGLSTFNSDNTVRLDIEGVKKKLLEIPYVQRELKKWRMR